MKNLSGHWTGVYDYPDSSMEPVPFNVVICDNGGSFYGEIIEPHLNTFKDEINAPPELHADISGHYLGSNIQFIKQYPALLSEYFDSVNYIGTINEEFTKIEGRWVIPGEWSGMFVMDRISGKETTTDNHEKVVLPVT